MEALIGIEGLDEERREWLAKPEGLSPAGEKAWEIICQFLVEKDLTNSGGCPVFYSPKQWREKRDHALGSDAQVIVHHVTGDHRLVFASNADTNWYEQLIERLAAHQLTCSQLSDAYSAVVQAQKN